MKTIKYLWVFTFMALILFCSNVTAQEKVRQNAASLKIVKNNQVLIDTTIYNSSPELEKELQELLKDKVIVILRSMKSGEETKDRIERDIRVFRRNEIDSMIQQIQHKLQEIRLQVAESEELNEVMEEMRVKWERIRGEMDSIRLKIIQGLDGFQPPQVYFFKDDDRSNEVVVIKKSREVDNEAVNEEKVIKKVLRRDLKEKDSCNREAREIILHKDEENIIELEGIRIIMPDKNTMKIEKHDEGYYEIESGDGKVVIIQVKRQDEVSSEPVKESKRRRRMTGH